MKASEKIKTIKEGQAASLEWAIDMGYDIVEALYQRCCCGECAKLRGRWFSISGKDKRFPKLPTNYECTCFGLTFCGVWEYSNSISNNCGIEKMIEISNRPFVDDRTNYEIEYCDIQLKKFENELFWEEYEDRWGAIWQYDRDQYELLLKLFPDKAPKSYSGYMRMKKQNTNNFQKLVQFALENNIFLEYPAEIQIEIELLTPIRQKYIRTLTECNRKYQEIQKLLE